MQIPVYEYKSNISIVRSTHGSIMPGSITTHVISTTLYFSEGRGVVGSIPANYKRLNRAQKIAAIDKNKDASGCFTSSKAHALAQEL